MSMVHHPIQVLSVLVTGADATAGLGITRAGTISGAGVLTTKGVVYKDTKVGAMAPVGTIGTFPATSGAAFSQGAYLTTDAAGKWIAATMIVGDSATGQAIPSNAKAQAEEAATAADQTVIIRML